MNFSVKNTIKVLVITSFGEETYRTLRQNGLKLESSIRNTVARVQQIKQNRGLELNPNAAVKKAGVEWELVKDLNLNDAISENFLFTTSALDAFGITWWLVSNFPSAPSVIGVNSSDRTQVLRAIASAAEGSRIYVTPGRPSPAGPILHASRIPGNRHIESAVIFEVYSPKMISGTEFTFGREGACQVEIWDSVSGGHLEAPRENRAARSLSSTDFHLVVTEAFGRNVLIPEVLTKKMLDDVLFPVDAVYTWVDGEDEDWIESKKRTEAEIAGTEYHGEANHAARFRSRDELKYSLRSLEMFAPWFRTIYIVTAGQTPDWLNTNNPKVKIVDHKDIYPESGYLPTFNSNSIISRLHHIEDLSEHYVYINDDVFFGRRVGKDRFFLPNGIAKVSPSNNRRPFGDPTAQDEPHLNLTRNMRSLLEKHFGVTISRAIKHTPHPQLRSVHFEMESTFEDAYAKTWASRFRHHTDIVADQLHHYYAQIVGKAVPANLRYNYINILDDKYRATMDSTLRLRNRDAFCINDAPVDGATPIPDEDVTAFLEEYFPVKSSYEK